MSLGQLDVEASRKIIEVNLTGAVIATEVVLPYMLKQQQGQIAICG